MLYPQENEHREVKDLSGLWKFKLDGKGLGLSEKWYAAPLIDALDMPVPSSFNDITPDKAVRDAAAATAWADCCRCIATTSWCWRARRLSGGCNRA